MKLLCHKFIVIWILYWAFQINLEEWNCTMVVIFVTCTWYIWHFSSTSCIHNSSSIILEPAVGQNKCFVFQIMYCHLISNKSCRNLIVFLLRYLHANRNYILQLFILVKIVNSQLFQILILLRLMWTFCNFDFRWSRCVICIEGGKSMVFPCIEFLKHSFQLYCVSQTHCIIVWKKWQ